MDQFNSARPSKKNSVYLFIIALLIAACGYFYYSFHYKPAEARQVEVFYNHDRAANEEITKIIQDADEFVYFAVYTFTREDIRDALLGAKYRGLTVTGIVDKKQSSSLDGQKVIVRELEKAGIPLVYNDHSYIMHLKAMVTDKAYVSGSYNWTAAATDNNDEIIEIGYDENIRSQYEKTLKEIIKKYEALSDQ